MSDLKSKLPDLKEIGHMASKLYKDVATSIQEIITDYKTKHPNQPEEKPKKTSTTKAKKEDK